MHSLPGHQLRPVAAGIGDVVHNHQMMLGVDGHLNIEADDAVPLPLVASSGRRGLLTNAPVSSAIASILGCAFIGASTLTRKSTSAQLTVPTLTSNLLLSRRALARVTGESAARGCHPSCRLVSPTTEGPVGVMSEPRYFASGQTPLANGLPETVLNLMSGVRGRPADICSPETYRFRPSAGEVR